MKRPEGFAKFVYKQDKRCDGPDRFYSIYTASHDHFIQLLDIWNRKEKMYFRLGYYEYSEDTTH